MRTASLAHLVAASDRNFYILKMHPNPQGPNVLANEFLGSLLLRELSLPCPEVRILDVDAAAIAAIRAQQHHPSQRRPTVGRHAGSRFPRPNRENIYEHLPLLEWQSLENHDAFAGMFVFDVWAAHQDRRQCVYLQDRRDGRLRVSFIDNGHLFGGPAWNWDHPQFPVRPIHYFQALSTETLLIDYYISQIRKVVPLVLHDFCAQVPTEWYQGDILALQKTLISRLAPLDSLVRDSVKGKLN